MFHRQPLRKRGRSLTGSGSPVAGARRLACEQLEDRSLLAILFSHSGDDAVRAIAPSETEYDDLGLDWIGGSEPIDDSSWSVTTGESNGVGYDRGDGEYDALIGLDLEAGMFEASTTAFLRAEFDVADPSVVDALRLEMRFDDGFIAWLNGIEVARSNVAGVYPAWDATATTSHEASLSSAEVFGLNHAIGLLNTGTNVLAIRGFNASLADDAALIHFSLIGESLEGPPIANPDFAMTPEDEAVTINILGNDQARSNPIDVSTLEITAAPTNGSVSIQPDGSVRYTPNANYFGADSFSYLVRDSSSGPSGNVTLVAANSAVKWHVPTSDALGTTWRGGDSQFSDAAWPNGTFGLGYDDNASPVDFSPHLATNVRAQMYNLNSSIYMRSTFAITNPANVSSLTLRIRCDDGFVAFLNGTKVASIYAPDSLTYNTSTNGLNGGDASALEFRTFDLTPYLGSLRVGANVLAIQGLNQFTTSSDLLMQPELTAMVAQSGQASNVGVVNIAVNPIPDAPTAAQDSYQVDEGGVLTVTSTPTAQGILANDADADGDPLTAVLTHLPTVGSLTLDDDGSFVYTPQAGFVGTTSFRYRASDGLLESPVTFVRIDVRHAAPTAGDDQFVTQRNQALTVPVANGVLANDTDTQGHPLTAQLVSGPAVGTLNLSSDGSFVYTPPANYTGVVSFTYKASDGTRDSQPATVTINVRLPPPVTRPETYAVIPGAEFSPEVAIASRPGPGHGLAMLVGAGQQILRFDAYTNEFLGVALELPANANGTPTFAFAPNGELFVAPVGSKNVLVYDLAFKALRRSFGDPLLYESREILFGADDLIYVLERDESQVRRYDPATGLFVDQFGYGQDLRNPWGMTFGPDGNLYTSTTILDRLYRFNGQTGVYIDQFTGFSDPLHLGFSRDGTLYVAGNAADRVYRYDVLTRTQLATPLTSISNPREIFHGPDDTLYVSSDDGFVRRYSVTTGALVNELVPAGGAAINEIILDATSFKVGGVLSNDDQRDGVTAELVTPPVHGQLTFLSDGRFDYTPDPGFSGVDSFAYRAVHAGIASADTQVTLNVGHYITGESDDYEVDEDTTLVVDLASGVLANDADTENLPMTAVIESPPEHGDLVLAADGSFEYRPDANYHGDDWFRYRAARGSRSSEPVLVRVRVHSINDVPVARNDSYQASEYTQLNGSTVLANDSDGDGGPLTAVVVTPAAHAYLLLSENGTFIYRPNFGYVGPDQFTYRVWDGIEFSEPATVSINVVHVRPFGIDDAYVNLEDAVLDVPASNGVLANDRDAFGHALTAQLETTPNVGTVTLRPDGGFRYFPPLNYSGTVFFDYRAHDGVRPSNATRVTITVNAVNDAPESVPERYFTEVNVPLVVSTAGAARTFATFTGIAEVAAFPVVGEVTEMQYSAAHGLIFLLVDFQRILTLDAQTGVLVDERLAVNQFRGMDLTPDGRYLFAADYNTSPNPNHVHRFNLSTRTWESQLAPQVAFRIQAVDEHRVLLLEYGQNIDLTLNRWTNDGTGRMIELSRTDGGVESWMNYDHDHAVVRYAVDATAILYLQDVHLQGDSLVPGARYSGYRGSIALSADGRRLYVSQYELDAASPSRRLRLLPDSILAESAKYALSTKRVYNALNYDYLGELPFTAHAYAVSPDERHIWAHERAAGVLHHLVLPEFGVLANDHEVENQNLTAVLHAGPAHGSIQLAANGTFTYTPTPGFVGFDRFSYRASDGTLSSAPIEVAIAVGATAERADVNFDGNIDVADVARVIGSLGKYRNSGQFDSVVDLDDDGKITLRDAITVRNAMPSSPPSPAAEALVRSVRDRPLPAAVDRLFARAVRRPEATDSVQLPGNGGADSLVAVARRSMARRR